MNIRGAPVDRFQQDDIDQPDDGCLAGQLYEFRAVPRRVGLFELLVVSDAIRALIVTKPTASAIRAIALKEGMRGLRDDGCAKIREGFTTMAEVLRVVSDVEI